ncbi:pyrroloquinoline quinone biosynthesis protein PqqB [Streptomyces sp. NPDC008150]|uniref:pyrroloquinoline quinone biosynthesis protein PqqB n=1 Tax=Streptomyces sp. NPDC008150 TaxID=3364816 RepID=UPI0036E2A70C
MLLRTLGTAAGGGVPQWNCACPGCTGARAHPGWRRRHDCLAVLGAAPGSWVLVNATPDIADQLQDQDELRPGAGEDRTPIVRIVLTDAELDHTLGLFRLREARHLEITATAPVRRALTERLRLDEVLGPYTTLTWRELPLAGEGTVDLAGIEVDALPLSAKRPRYAAGEPPEAGWSVAVRLRDPATGGTALYAPALAEWSESFENAVTGVDCAFVDGTFWDDEEPRSTGISTRTATGMGHLPVSGPDGTADRLAKTGTRCFYTHLNNTNPLVDPAAPQHALLGAPAPAVAQEGMEVSL